jgi:hypothetical protein
MGPPYTIYRVWDPLSLFSPFFVSFGYGGLACGRGPRCGLCRSIAISMIWGREHKLLCEQGLQLPSWACDEGGAELRFFLKNSS